MFQTRTLLNTHFPKEVTNVIVSYITSKNRDWWEIAHVGEYETCLNIPNASSDRGLYGACAGGHIELAELMISRGATIFDGGLYNACYHGHEDIAQLMISLGANNLDRAFVGALRGGHRETINFIKAYPKHLAPGRILWRGK
jgi:hypothetical protein